MNRKEQTAFSEHSLRPEIRLLTCMKLSRVNKNPDITCRNPQIARISAVPQNSLRRCVPFDRNSPRRSRAVEHTRVALLN